MPDDPRARGRSLWPDHRPDHQLRPLPDPRPTDRGPERRSVSARAPIRPPAPPRAARRRHPTPATPRTPARSSGSARPTPTPSSSSCAAPTSRSCRRSPRPPSPSTTRAGSPRTSIRPSTGPQAIVDQVNGTGPYRLESWTHGSEVSLARNDGYWGDKAANERLIARWYDNAGQRIAELQNASVDGVDDIDPTAVQAVVDDTDLKLAPRPGLERLLRRLHRHLRTVRQRARPPGDRHRHRPPAHRRHLLPAGLGAGHALHAVRDPARVRGRRLVRVRPDPGQGDARRRPASRTASIRRSSTARRRPTTCPTRPASRPSSRTSCSPTSGSEPSSRSSRTTPSSPTPARASSTASTCSARA